MVWYGNEILIRQVIINKLSYNANDTISGMFNVI